MHFNLSGALIRTLNDLLRTTQLAETGSTEHNAVSRLSYLFIMYYIFELILYFFLRGKEKKSEAHTITNYPTRGVNTIQAVRSCGRLAIVVHLSCWMK